MGNGPVSPPFSTRETNRNEARSARPVYGRYFNESLYLLCGGGSRMIIYPTLRLEIRTRLCGLLVLGNFLDE
jgi:hypothetical protein